MGLLVDGIWQDRWYDTESTKGRYKRRQSQFRTWVTSDGSPGPAGVGGFKAEPGRYHLYVSYACPWAHRTLIYRKLKGLEGMIPVSVVHWLMAGNGWTFQPGHGVTADPVNKADYLYEVYLAADPDYTGRVTVPIFWDTETNTIVSNESADIIRMFNSAFDQSGATVVDYYPPDLRAEIDALNSRIYDTVNNGVYKSGFAATQDAYDEAVQDLFASLDWLEDILSRQRYLAGANITEADWRLFTTLVRFDSVYVGHFKCNIRRIADYPNIWAYTRDLYQQPHIAETVHMDHIKKHYYQSHRPINPTGIVPLGPEVDFDLPHDRDRLA